MAFKHAARMINNRKNPFYGSMKMGQIRDPTKTTDDAWGSSEDGRACMIEN